MYEVHLITTIQYQTQLFGYIANLNDSRLIRPRPTCAHTLYGDYPIQPMLTFWIHGEYNNILNIVTFIENDMNNKGIPVLRTKIEALAHHATMAESHYYEFHFKVKNINTSSWNELVHLITPFGAHLFYNPYSKTLDPIGTIRSYDSLQQLQDIFNDLLALLTEHGFTITEIEKEYSMLDTNVALDKNWLFHTEPHQFITTVTDQMLFKF